MPELPDIHVYQQTMSRHLVGHPLKKIRLGSPFLLRSVTPALAEFKDRSVLAISRLGKRLVFCLEEEYYLVLHLMIAGRLHWKKPAAPLPRKSGLACFDFDHGTLLLTESSSKKRASLFAVHGMNHLKEHDPGGIDLFESTLATFQSTLQSQNNTLKRALTDPRRFDGIGNAYSDEILHKARLSPLQLTQNLKAPQVATLFEAAREVLKFWMEKLSAEAGQTFPKKVTAFHPDMAIHGRFRQPCLVCQSTIQRIVRGEREVNYCPTCQTGGKMLADRAWSKLLKKDWPKTLEAWEALQQNNGT